VTIKVLNAVESGEEGESGSTDPGLDDYGEQDSIDKDVKSAAWTTAVFRSFLHTLTFFLPMALVL